MPWRQQPARAWRRRAAPSRRSSDVASKWHSLQYAVPSRCNQRSQQVRTMSLRLAVVPVLLLAPLAASAQTPSYIVTRLGNDTVAVERYTRNANRLEGDLVL